MAEHMLLIASCVACGTIIPSLHPTYCPSLLVNGRREPLCLGCFHRWNEINRTSKGLPPETLHPRAYSNPEPGEI